MLRVVGIDHLVLSVSDFHRSKAFYDRLLKFLGFRVLDEYADYMGWTNGKTRVWIARADAEGRRRHRKGDVGFHHYAFELENRAAVDALQEFLDRNGIEIVDRAGEHYPDYYAVYFLDPDGMKLEGMRYGPARKRRAASRRKKASRKRRKSG